MKVVSTEALTKLIQLVKSAFVSVEDVVETQEVTLADVALSGDYDDLINKPTIPAAQVNSDWNAVSGVAQILNKPTLATVATSGSYNDLSNKPTIPTVNNATLTITQGGVSKGTFTANASSDVTIALDSGGGSDRNIGEIVASTIPLSDAGLHLLDGALINGSGSYADFVTYISGLVSAYPDLFETEANWQTSVTTYGVCGKFVYDSVNNTVRLPLITGFIEGTNDYNALGILTAAGLPNITGSAGYTVRLTSASGAFDYGSGGSANQWGSGEWGAVNPFTFDASRSSSIYGRSNTVQPQSIKVLYYIVIATSTKTDIQVDIDEIATDLNGKADTDLSNCTKPYITETYVNGTSWYRVYSDGWCEQGGRATISSYYANITFLKQFVDTNYNIGFAQNGFSEDTYCANVDNFTNSTMQLRFRGGGTFCFWQACGYIS